MNSNSSASSGMQQTRNQDISKPQTLPYACDHYQSCKDIESINQALAAELAKSQDTLEQVLSVLRIYGIKDNPEPQDISSAIHLLQGEVNKRVETEMRLRDTIKTMNTVFDIIQEGLCSINSNGTINNWNTAAEIITGWLKQDAIGLGYKTIFPQIEIGITGKHHTSQNWLHDVYEKKAAEELISCDTIITHRNGSLIKARMIKAVLRSTIGVLDILCFKRLSD